MSKTRFIFQYSILVTSCPTTALIVVVIAVVTVVVIVVVVTVGVVTVVVKYVTVASYSSPKWNIVLVKHAHGEPNITYLSRPISDSLMKQSSTELVADWSRQLCNVFSRCALLSHTVWNIRYIWVIQYNVCRHIWLEWNRNGVLHFYILNKSPIQHRLTDVKGKKRN